MTRVSRGWKEGDETYKGEVSSPHQPASQVPVTIADAPYPYKPMIEGAGSVVHNAKLAELATKGCAACDGITCDRADDDARLRMQLWRGVHLAAREYSKLWQ
jgi:hypothetical protein